MELVKLKRKQGVQTSNLVMINQVPFLQFPILENTGIVKHGFSTRLGGVSKGIFRTMNLSFTRGDGCEEVLENFRRISSAIGFDYRDIVTSDQTHTANIRIAGAADKGKGIIKNRDYENIDGLITNEPGVPLAAFFADCVPLYFVDPVKKVIALSHSGWRGTVNKIGQRTIEAMQNSFGSKPEDVIACIAPSICRDCYEVGLDVAGMFYEAFPSEQAERILTKKDNGKYQLDLWKANEIILTEAGILSEHLALPDICTCCNKEVLFSHRGSQGMRGNLGAFLMLE